MARSGLPRVDGTGGIQLGQRGTTGGFVRAKPDLNSFFGDVQLLITATVGLGLFQPPCVTIWTGAPKSWPNP
jgi:hypothetical protein